MKFFLLIYFAILFSLFIIYMNLNEDSSPQIANTQISIDFNQQLAEFTNKYQVSLYRY